ncbi:His Kinase A (phospho-acceptor) domain-containing protein [Desulfonatronum thiosulfatophilum]|uniref:histidine kinase n=1 Tax=Desulfonatronum thiosulfatophilum TaxID=617002 RepID=A0A1G6DNK5_9BACT|nr:HDOD domain-containing protein [Desulfonatronum thiosulfatophilum]SDB46754.1 His Kinase A (phospho-acceptor) domain-containing protein [Desulfonatronum thiosulfatophilum]
MLHERMKKDDPMADPAGMRSMIRRIEELPTLPTVAVQALTLSMQDDADIGQLSRIMESDPVLTARILRLVNNVQTGLRSKVGTVNQAVALAGLTQVRCALLGVLIREYLPDVSQRVQAEFKSLWTHSLMTGIIARLLAKKTFPELQETAFVGGLLHDIGKVVIMDVFPDAALSIEEVRDEKRLSSEEAEQLVLGTTHCLAGKILAESWNLPNSLVDCIWMHHDKFYATNTASLNWEIRNIIALANSVARDLFCEQPCWLDMKTMSSTLLNALDLSQEDFAGIKQEAIREYEGKAAFFNLENDLDMIFHDVIQGANRKLSQLGLDLDSKNKTLSKLNSCLTLSRKLGIQLGTVRTRQELFSEVALAFKGFSSVPIGIFYAIDHQTHELEGIVWVDGGRRRKLLCFTNHDGEPVWEHEDQSLPAELRRVLANYKLRMLDTRTITPNACSPFTIYSFGDPETYFAELVISLQQDAQDQGGEVWTNFLQIAQMLRSTIENVMLLERLQAKQEDLALALWNNQQVNLQLIQAERLAAVGQLAAGAAHEINNPLAIISARAQLMECKEQDEKRRGELALISEQIERISKILTNLMDFARPCPPKLQSVDVHAVLDRVLELMNTGYRKHAINIRKNYDPQMIPIKADPNQLEQVFLNLSINAQHAMEASGGDLTVSTQMIREGRGILVKIQDQGVGISKDNLKKIFDPFFTTKEQGKGTGLGLSTSIGIVNNHFGKIEIESEVGKGTTFTVELPVDITALRPENSTSGPSCPLIMAVRPRILVVDDEEHIRRVLQEALENENMIVVTAENGREGLQRLAEGSFDLMLMDIKMPFVDGLTLLREVRRSGATLPVIAITGMASREEVEEAGKHGCKCLRKPFHIKSLLAEVQDRLRT